ncbi:S-adenosylmethionine:tRNA ribosyltransferase-isomerase [Rubripirellula obstinata]|nr:S-adenosylmethionine:tRNA ribosyltransferase-isomerase [Rubripirellula obstinata]
MARYGLLSTDFDQGRDLALEAYRVAIENGDAMLIV